MWRFVAFCLGIFVAFVLILLAYSHSETLHVWRRRGTILTQGKINGELFQFKLSRRYSRLTVKEYFFLERLFDNSKTVSTKGKPFVRRERPCIEGAEEGSISKANYSIGLIAFQNAPIFSTYQDDVSLGPGKYDGILGLQHLNCFWEPDSEAFIN